MKEKEELRIRANSLCSAVIRDNQLTDIQREELLGMCNSFYQKFIDNKYSVDELRQFIRKIQDKYKEFKQTKISISIL